MCSAASTCFDAHFYIALICPCFKNAETTPMLPNQDPALCSFSDEWPPKFERQLYLILRDKEIRDADPQSLLPKALATSGVCRLQAAKALTADSLCLEDVPAAARTRFLELLDATPSETGT
jgi:hypothetical protein